MLDYCRIYLEQSTYSISENRTQINKSSQLNERRKTRRLWPVNFATTVTNLKQGQIRPNTLQNNWKKNTKTYICIQCIVKEQFKRVLRKCKVKFRPVKRKQQHFKINPPLKFMENNWGNRRDDEYEKKKWNNRTRTRPESPKPPFTKITPK